MAYSNLFKFWLYLIQKKSYNTLFLCDSFLSHSTFFVARHFFVALSTQLLQYIMLIFLQNIIVYFPTTVHLTVQ
jgi:hypothetical protein